MGGYNSGRWGWHRTRKTTNDAISLDIRELAREHALRPGHYSYAWSRGGRRFASVGLTIDSAEPDAVILEYAVSVGGGPSRSVRDVVPIARTACTYGGSRHWFVCPGCHRRRAVLYAPGVYFRCRECEDLAYGSTRDTPGERARAKANRLKRRLGDPNPGPFWVPLDKPKGMHWTTYSRLVREIIAREGDVEREFDLALARLTTQFDRIKDQNARYFDDDPVPEPEPRGEVFESFCNATIGDVPHP